ncbi:MAG TPA: hypothetical protein VFG53_05945 [Anaeromyxobacter sp.]|nr:hypothetical protein [Anaeromyxobacter sp.]
MTREMMKGAALAAAVFSMFAASSVQADDKMEKSKTGAVQCAGINSCKGQGSCAGADNSCKGQNSCKGKGWTQTQSAKDCTDKGGTVVASK